MNVMTVIWSMETDVTLLVELSQAGLACFRTFLTAIKHIDLQSFTQILPQILLMLAFGLTRQYSWILQRFLSMIQNGILMFRLQDLYEDTLFLMK